MDETRERFLTAIVGRLGADRIVEVHLFSPIRQGLLETGVAVVAALPEVPAAAVIEESAVLDVVQDENARPDEEDDGVDAGVDAGVDGGIEEGDNDDPYLAEPIAEPIAEPVAVAAPIADPRHVVLTARYRLTRKGPDRGKWLFELAATADAPLATVDMVVRGVMHRSKDLTETERMSGDQLRAALAEPAWRTTT